MLNFTALFTSLFLLITATQAQQPTTGTNCNVVLQYIVKPGDSLDAIRMTNGNVTFSQITLVNPQITNPGSIKPNDRVNIPNPACVAPEVKPLAEPTATCSNGTESTIRVVSGDTFSIIAKERLRITVEAFKNVNAQVKDINVIEVGELLNVPLCVVGGIINGAASANSTSSSASPKASSNASGMEPSATTAPPTASGLPGTTDSPNNSTAPPRASASASTGSFEATPVVIAPPKGVQRRSRVMHNLRQSMKHTA